MTLSRTQRSVHAASLVSWSTANLITTPTSTTAVHGVRCMRESGGRPPKMRVASTGPLSSAVMTGRRSVDRNLLANRDIGELKIVHDGHRNTVDVEHLAVEEVQLGVQPASSLILATRCHRPAPVMIKSGIAARAAARMITR